MQRLLISSNNQAVIALISFDRQSFAMRKSIQIMFTLWEKSVIIKQILIMLTNMQIKE